MSWTGSRLWQEDGCVGFASSFLSASPLPRSGALSPRPSFPPRAWIRAPRGSPVASPFGEGACVF